MTYAPDVEHTPEGEPKHTPAILACAIMPPVFDDISEEGALAALYAYAGYTVEIEGASVQDI